MGANVDISLKLTRPATGDILAVMFEGNQDTGRGVTTYVTDTDGMN